MGSVEIIDQPNRGRTGDRLKTLLENNGVNHFETFYILSAYVKSSGVERLREAIQQFKGTGAKVFAVVGIGQKNTSIQGLQILHSVCNEARIYHNESRTSTFHPKVYVFEKPKEKAVVFIGSSNLTGGGLFTNYEAITYAEYDLKDSKQAAKFDEVRGMINFYSTESEFCKTLTPELIAEIAEDYLSDETKQTPEEREEGELIPAEAVKKKVFGTKTIRPPPLPKSSIKRQQVLQPILPIAAQPTVSAPMQIEGCDWSKMGVIRWRKKLLDRDCQIVSVRTAPTGSLSLTQAKWSVNGKRIDQKSFFRFDLFGGFIWKQARPAYNVETTEVTFCVRITGKDEGLHRLTLRYNPEWESEQNNYTTGLSWGTLGKLIKNPALVGKYFSIYSPSAGASEPFFLVIE